MGPRDDLDVRRLVYTSTRLRDGRAADLDAILAQSRRNNGMNGVSGVLVATGDSYLQVLEGTPEAVGFIMGVIRQDPRHTDVQVLSDTRDDERAFGDWAMANLSGARDEAEVRRRLHHLLRDAPVSVKGAFAAID